MPLSTSLTLPGRTPRSVLPTLAIAAAGALILMASPSFAGDPGHGHGHGGHGHGHRAPCNHNNEPHFTHYSAPRYYSPAYYYARPVYVAPRPVAYVRPAPVYYQQPRSFVSISW
jgi:hypothetical protein